MLTGTVRAAATSRSPGCLVTSANSPRPNCCRRAAGTLGFRSNEGVAGAAAVLVAVAACLPAAPAGAAGPAPRPGDAAASDPVQGSGISCSPVWLAK